MNFLKRLLITILFSAGIFTVLTTGISAENLLNPKVEYFLATVTKVEKTKETSEGYTLDNIQAKLLEGPEKGKVISFAYYRESIKESEISLSKGETIYIYKTTYPGDETPEYSFHAKYRIPVLILVVVVFIIIILIFAGLKGGSALLGLVFSILVLLGFVVPQILAGNDPLLVSLGGIAVIGLISFYLTHGFNKKTTIALVSTFAVLIIAAISTIVLTELAKFSGVDSDETLLLKNELGDINLKGLLLSAILFGVLGVLDDVTISQVSTVLEIKKADRKLSVSELYKRATNVGKDHVASLVNTLVLAYVASSLSFLLFFMIHKNVPLAVILNEEFVATEIFRSIIGSTAIILAVPISTYLAALAVNKWSDMAKGDSSSHNHSY
jgi:uncharacterized membrane protein